MFSFIFVRQLIYNFAACVQNIRHQRAHLAVKLYMVQLIIQISHGSVATDIRENQHFSSYQYFPATTCKFLCVGDEHNVKVYQQTTDIDNFR